PNQNGAPVRVVVPWKYGFKSAKSIVKIRFVDKQPATSWNLAAAQEYGFYSNVNPDVDHPRWSQSTERRIGEDKGSGFRALFAANPLEFVTRSTGTWTLVMLCVTLAVTPLRRLTGWNWLIRLRRMLGLFVFFYALQHFLLWLGVDRGFDVAYMIKDIAKRPFI